MKKITPIIIMLGFLFINQNISNKDTMDKITTILKIADIKVKPFIKHKPSFSIILPVKTLLIDVIKSFCSLPLM